MKFLALSMLSTLAALVAADVSLLLRPWHPLTAQDYANFFDGELEDFGAAQADV